MNEKFIISHPKEKKGMGEGGWESRKEEGKKKKKKKRMMKENG
jgi:hypothetical protein